MNQSDDLRFAPPLDDELEMASPLMGEEPEPPRPEAAQVADQPAPFWQRWLASLISSDEQRSQRLRELSLAIEAYPQTVANYVLRGELFLQDRQTHLARADFEKALRLATQQIESSRWGLIDQAMLERAQQGLARVRRLS